MWQNTFPQQEQWNQHFHNHISIDQTVVSSLRPTVIHCPSSAIRFLVNLTYLRKMVPNMVALPYMGSFRWRRSQTHPYILSKEASGTILQRIRDWTQDQLLISLQDEHPLGQCWCYRVFSNYFEVKSVLERYLIKKVIWRQQKQKYYPMIQETFLDDFYFPKYLHWTKCFMT